MSQSKKINNIVFVHGAFADGSSWAKVLPILIEAGYHVTSVQNPLTSFAEDVAAVKRAIAVQDGPVILVGHSYGGVVITEAGNDPKVAGLVYVAAFAPGAGESIVDISKDFPKPAGLDKVVPQPDGFLLLSSDGIATAFAQDLTQQEKSLLTAVQPQTSGAIFAAQPTAAAWEHKPSSYIITTDDHMIAPEQQVAMANRIKARTTTLPSSHAVMLSHPEAVAAVIQETASAAL